MTDTPDTPPNSYPTGAVPSAAHSVNAPASASTFSAVHTNPPATLRSSPTPPKPRPQDHSLASVIDTIEAIIIALIIALTFRAFIVEAFVIPTGSMAPTLLGAHFKVICPSCGYAYDRNASLWHQLRPLSSLEGGGIGISHTPDYGAELTSNRTVPADESSPIFCPNCAYPIAPNLLPQFLGYTQTLYDGRREAKRNIPTAWANNGDRILVMKYLYSILEPSRFDVIVFKEPQAAQFNYIKRLIGLPGETVEIVGGDIFVAPPGKTAPADREIARKPDHLQSSLWQLVYDNDHYPVDEGRPRPPLSDASSPSAPWVNPWTPHDALRWTHGTAMTLSGAGPGALQFNFRHPYGLNILGYNNDSFLFSPNLEEPLYPVGDLRLEALWAPSDSSSTAVTLTLGRSDNLFRAAWSADKVALQRFDPGSRTFKDVTSVTYRPALPGQSYRLALDNVDHAVHFWVNGAKVLSYEPRWSAEDAHTEEQTREAQGRASAMDAQIRVDVSGACTLSHLKIFRDLYYTPGYSGPRTAAARPLTLGADEFFALGDNSRKSSDGRAWDRVFPALDDLATRPGIVPRRYLLGKAFFVYWPAGYRITSNESIPLARDLPLVPNTGSMRFIR